MGRWFRYGSKRGKRIGFSGKLLLSGNFRGDTVLAVPRRFLANRRLTNETSSGNSFFSDFEKAAAGDIGAGCRLCTYREWEYV